MTIFNTEKYSLGLKGKQILLLSVIEIQGFFLNCVVSENLQNHSQY